MKRLLTFIMILFLLLLPCSFISAQIISTEIPKDFDLQKNSQALRILTYNIRACRGLDDSYGLNPELVANIISSINPDIAGIQEVDRNNTRSVGKDQIFVLAEMTNLHSYFGKAIDFAGGEYGIGALSKKSAISYRTVALPGSEEARALIEVELEDVVLFNSHLSLTSESREEAAVIINREVDLYQKPIVLTGDMNVSGKDEIAKLFSKRWTILSPNEASFPADTPKEQLDYILICDPTNKIPVNAPLWTESVLKSGVIPTIASDHRPVYVDLDWGKIKSEL